MKNSLGIYVHWPFCKSLCPYCDFNSHVSQEIDHSRWLNAYLKELDHFAAQLVERAVTSIFFGGGTPSLMEPRVVEKIIHHIARRFSISSDCEVTLEANPTSVEAGKLKDFKFTGINRLSLGIQSLDPESLAFLGRKHSAQEAKGAIRIAAALFDNYSFDLIYARPNQALESWKSELEEALSLAGPHLSLYQLTIEKGTPFYQAYRDGVFTLPSSDLSADLYELTQEIMTDHGLPAYEVSNHARASFECQHNLLYWHYGEYLGIGPGAHGRLKTNHAMERRAVMMIHQPENWLNAVNKKGCGIQQNYIINGRGFVEECIMMCLRQNQGFTEALCQEHFGQPLSEAFDSHALASLAAEGLIQILPRSLHPTQKGWQVLNSLTHAIIEACLIEDGIPAAQG